MKIIKTYYLIDYENVGSEGFKGCEKLRETDIIHLFYTDNSRKIDLDIINDHGESKLVTHKVPTGNQSADMHLGSYLGYLIGKECTGQDEECKIVVISKDTGFDHIIEFWKAEENVKISRNEKISGKQVQTRKQVKKQPEWVLKCYPRSGLGFKYRLQLNNTVGIIDRDYFNSDNEGHIFSKITNDSNENKTLTIPADTGFMQGIFVEYGITVDDDATEIRNGGFGSTTAK